MPGCPNGSEPNDNAPSVIEIRYRDIISLKKSGREDLDYAGGGLITAFDILTFCGSSPESSYQPASGAADGIIRAFNGVVDEKWGANCRCKLPPRPPEALIGGQCRTKYYVSAIFRYQYYLPPYTYYEGGGEGSGFGPLRVFTTLKGTQDNNYDYWYVRGEDGDGNFLFSPGVNGAKIGSISINVTVRRLDGLLDNCGDQPVPEFRPPNPPPNFVFAPLELPPPPVCDCPAPGTLFIPTPIPIPVPPIIIPVPIPIPIPFPFPLPSPNPVPLPPPNSSPDPKDCPPCLPCDCPPTPKLPEKPKDMDCCPELISRITRLQGDMTQLKDVDTPKFVKHFDERFDGLIECLDFQEGTDFTQNVLGNSLTGTSVLNDRAVGVSVRATSPTPANRSLRQDGLNTPDVLQGGWCWFSYDGGVSTRQPLDAEKKFFPVPVEYRKFTGLSFVWRGVHEITYSVSEHLRKERESPPFPDRPCE